MSDESIVFLKYAISVGWHNLLETFDAFESMDNTERNKYYTMCEELAEQLSINIDELTDHF